eukprot:TRINITY_DN629_c0_g1_i1.p1 TRINITY_DN629_c0_g1~~TRINITY_DN629_c0_g1_i1.p1  ORF type:complete len:350 (-),score=86.14 TRINITY_DN629_c0_g1_i1:886-1905(-)
MEDQNMLYMRCFQPALMCHSLHLRNRIVMAPMTRRFAKDGVLSKESVEYYRIRAADGIGLIISEGVGVDDVHAVDAENIPLLRREEQVNAWMEAVEAVHKEGGAICLQLWHQGKMSRNPIGPVAICDRGKHPRKGYALPSVMCMTRKDMDDVTSSFVETAKNCKKIGVDAIEIHGAHGYLLDDFVNPHINVRSDGFGGDSIENRMRFPMEVVRAVREAVGDEYPLLYRMSQWQIENFYENKFEDLGTLDVFVNALKDNGVDVIDVSTRRTRDTFLSVQDKEKCPSCFEIPKKYQEKPYNIVVDMPLVTIIHRLSGLPCIAVGNVCSGLNIVHLYDPSKQ